MSKLIVKYWGDTDNPRNFPAGYPAEAMEIDDKDTAPDGWTATTKDAYQKAIDDNREAVVLINKTIEEQEAAQRALEVEQTKTEIEVLQVHVDSVNQGSVTDDDRLAAVDAVASLLVKFGPVLEQLLVAQNENKKP